MLTIRRSARTLVTRARGAAGGTRGVRDGVRNPGGTLERAWESVAVQVPPVVAVPALEVQVCGEPRACVPFMNWIGAGGAGAVLCRAGDCSRQRDGGAGCDGRGAGGKRSGSRGCAGVCHVDGGAAVAGTVISVAGGESGGDGVAAGGSEGEGGRCLSERRRAGGGVPGGRDYGDGVADLSAVHFKDDAARRTERRCSEVLTVATIVVGVPGTTFDGEVVMVTEVAPPPVTVTVFAVDVLAMKLLSPL